jgi:hypothetical protein
MSISRRRMCGAILSALIIGLVTMNGAVATRAIPDDNLAYPVLIAFKSEGTTGSGFYLNTDKATYLVTAKHVLFNPDTHKLRGTVIELLSYSKDPSDPKRNLVVLDLSILERDGNVKVHPSEDVAVIKIGEILGDSASKAEGNPREMSPPPGVIFQEMATAGILGVAAESVQTFDHVLTGNEVILFGYPTSLGLKELPQLDPLRPLLRKGLVAGQNPQKRSIVLDCPSYPGNSGGLVLEIESDGFQRRFRAIGVVREFVPFDIRSPYSQFILNSGYSIATPMDFVLELIQ